MDETESDVVDMKCFLEEDGYQTSDTQMICPPYDSDDEDQSDSPIVSIDLRTNSRLCWNYTYLAVCLYIFLLVIIVVSVIVFCMVIILLVVPYIRTLAFEQTSCTVFSAYQTSTQGPCTCDKPCDSHYPCIHVQIQFFDSNATLRNSTLWENEVSLKKECTFYPPCKYTTSGQLKTVRDYVNKYGTPGLTYGCLYNKNNMEEVIRTHRFQLHHVVHGVVWSSLVLIISIGLLTLALRKRCQ